MTASLPSPSGIRAAIFASSATTTPRSTFVDSLGTLPVTAMASACGFSSHHELGGILQLLGYHSFNDGRTDMNLPLAFTNRGHSLRSLIWSSFCHFKTAIALACILHAFVARISSPKIMNAIIAQHATDFQSGRH